MREIIFDTETTGFDPMQGDRLVEIGCVEMIDGVLTGRQYHVYLNPERDVPPQAAAVHGLTTAFLRNKPIFAEEVGNFMDFIADDRLIAHNASFDMNFINFEIKRLGFPVIDPVRVVDTLQIAREKFPGSPASLDALCKRFGVDNSNRDLHGALLDAQLLAQVYIELTGGRQRALDFVAEDETTMVDGIVQTSVVVNRTSRLIALTSEAEHEALLDLIKEPLWRSAS